MNETMQIKTRISKDDYTQLKELAETYDCTLYEYVRHIIKEHLSSKVESTPKHTLANLKRAYKQHGFGNTSKVDTDDTQDLFDYDE